MTRGSDTRDTILASALANASEVGLEGLSIGNLARQTGMSKSGLFAHFGSKEELQIQVLQRAADLFTDSVVRPSIKAPRGEPRVRQLLERYLEWTNNKRIPGGCVFMSASFELDDRPGPVRDALVGHVESLRSVFRTAAQIAIDEGHFRADLDPRQFAFEVHGVVLAYHVQLRLFDDVDARDRFWSALDRIVASAKAD
ncbi:MAG: TetR/AcrR family transcriptional regulator [Deltaproteobacteria bacterium]|nr:MAG: TetR/AcrR family transcriptional regulator [Deltaproteobacteria bacterium]